MRLIYARSLMDWSRLKECHELDPREYIEQGDDMGEQPLQDIIFISHRWITPHHPDPEGLQLKELQHRLATIYKNEIPNDCVVFYDYCSLFQKPRTDEENLVFYRDMAQLRDAARSADKVIILSEGYSDYKNRAWCFFEAVVAENNVYFFNDQQEIKNDLDFLGLLMAEERHLLQAGLTKMITSYDLSYKINKGEAEIIIAAFQHLGKCKTTLAEDKPMIRRELARHYNNRRLTPSGHLLSALAYFFDVAFIVIPLGNKLSEPVICEPYFENSDWTRLPPMMDGPFDALMGLRKPGIFTVHQDIWRGQDHSVLLQGLLRLTMPGVSDYGEFLARFQNDPDWERYVLHPARVGISGLVPIGDEFPGGMGTIPCAAAISEIDHISNRDEFQSLKQVIHTALEAWCFIVAADCVYIPL